MSKRSPTIVIVGTGVTGTSAARTLRGEGFVGRIVLIGDESVKPYRRPALSKDLLAGTVTLNDKRVQLEPDEFWADHDIELRTGTRVVELDPVARRVRLPDNEILGFDALLLASGARARQLNHDGGSKVLTLRRAADVDPLRAAIEKGRSLLVIGAGLVGCEVAATAAGLGAEVAVLGRAALSRLAPPEVAQMYQQLHAENGVRMHTGVTLASLAETSDDTVIATTTSGESWHADAALLAIGSEPETSLAQQAGLLVDNGVVVDDSYRTSADGVFAAGDVADRPNTLLGGRHRTEHWNSAQAQGVAAAKAMLGRPPATADVPWGWSNQYGLNLQFAGWTRHDDDYVVRGTIEHRNFTALALRDGRLVGAIALGRPKDIRAVRQLVAAGADLDPSMLADETIALASIADDPRTRAEPSRF